MLIPNCNSDNDRNNRWQFLIAILAETVTLCNIGFLAGN